MYLANDSVI